MHRCVWSKKKKQKQNQEGSWESHSPHEKLPAAAQMLKALTQVSSNPKGHGSTDWGTTSRGKSRPEVS